MVDLKDPIQVHLLTETALSDSREYEILSQEEVDELKKQSQLILQRIESVKTNLGIQAKYRDATNSMARLHSPGADGVEGPSRQEVRDAEDERERCERKCEELATQLFDLEKRLMEPNRRLLQHTAGVLQLTHKATKRKNTEQNGQVVNGMPGSPESLYTYPQSRASLDHGGDADYIDDSGLYPLDSLPRKNAIEIPMKSPIREQTTQLKEEVERLREENKQLRNGLAGTEEKILGANRALRETIVKFNPGVNDDYDEPPPVSLPTGTNVVAGLQSQLNYLDSSLVAIQAEQGSLSGSKATAERLEAMNLQLRDLLMTANHHYTPKPMPAEEDVPGQLAYLEDSLHEVDSELSRSMAAQGQGGQSIEESLKELWAFIQSGFADNKSRKEERRRARAENGLEEDEELSTDDEFATDEPYTLDELIGRVQWLFRQTTTLKDHKSVLKRQIKQQRELNNKSDAEKDAELQRKHEELERSRMLLHTSGKELREQLAAAEDESRRGAEKVAEAERRAQELQETLNATEEQYKAKENELEQLNLQVAELKTEVTMARAELDGAYGSRAERAAAVAAVQNGTELAKLQDQVEKLKEELQDTVKELEGITKESIASEREKVDLEGKLDDALMMKASLEAEIQKSRDAVSKLQDDLDTERFKASRASGTGKPSAGATMLSEQFRITMREERKKFQEDLKVRSSLPCDFACPLRLKLTMFHGRRSAQGIESSRTRSID